MCLNCHLACWACVSGPGQRPHRKSDLPVATYLPTSFIPTVSSHWLFSHLTPWMHHLLPGWNFFIYFFRYFDICVCSGFDEYLHGEECWLGLVSYPELKLAIGCSGFLWNLGVRSQGRMDGWIYHGLVCWRQRRFVYVIFDANVFILFFYPNVICMGEEATCSYER